MADRITAYTEQIPQCYLDFPDGGAFHNRIEEYPMTTALAYDPFNLQHTFPRHPEHSGRLAGT